MKNLFCALAFMLIGTLTYASNGIANPILIDAVVEQVQENPEEETCLEFNLPACGASGSVCGIETLDELMDVIEILYLFNEGCGMEETQRSSIRLFAYPRQSDTFLHNT